MYPFYEHKSEKIYIRQQERIRCKPHLHRHVEMVLVQEGTVEVTVDAARITLGAGDVLFVFPNQVHTYTDLDIRGAFVLIFAPEFVPAYSRAFQKYQPQSPVLRGGLAMGRLPDVLSAMLSEKTCTDAGADIRLSGYLTVLLGTLLPELPLQKIKTEGRDLLPQVLAYCMEHYRENLQLSDVADALHISKYYISHMLNGRLHMRFNTYLNAIRISEAMALLADPEQSITDVALQTGFDCLRTFDRAFRAQTGVSPRAYRALQHKEKNTG